MPRSLSTIALAELIAACENKEKFIAALDTFVAKCGAKCAVFYRFDSGLKAAADQWEPLYNSYPARVVEYYQAARCVTEDPFLRAAISSSIPVRIQEIERVSELSGSIRALGQIMRAHGLRDGLAMHVSDRLGHTFYFALGYDRDLDDVSDFERRRIQACIQMFVRHAADAILAPEEIRRLSPKERQVIACLARGETNKQIARSLGLSPSTVNTLVNRSFAKLGVSNRTEAVVAACRTDHSLVA